MDQGQVRQLRGETGGESAKQAGGDARQWHKVKVGRVGKAQPPEDVRQQWHTNRHGEGYENQHTSPSFPDRQNQRHDNLKAQQ